MNFKQSAVFNVLALFQVLALYVPTRYTRRTRLLLVTIGTALPLIGFLLVRLPANIASLPGNTVILVPWVLATVFCFRDFWSEERATTTLSPREFWIATTVCIAGTTPWLFFLLFKGISPVEAIHELYVRIPHLVDRENEPIAFGGAWIVGTLLGFLALELLYRAAVSRLEAGDHAGGGPAYRIAGNAALGALALAAGMCAVLLSWKDVLSWKWNLYQWAAALFSVAMIFVLRDHRRRFLGKSEGALIVFLAIAAAVGYPYYYNPIYAAGLVVLGFICVIMILRRLWPADGYDRRLATAVAAILLVAVLIPSFERRQWVRGAARHHFESIDVLAQKPYPNLLFVQLADWIRNNVPPDKTIGGYPNYGLTLALAGRTSFDRYPNFIGSREEFDILVKSIGAGHGPDYYLISPQTYPMGSVHHPSFPLATPLVEALSRDYRPVAEIQAPGGVVQVYSRDRVAGP